METSYFYYSIFTVHLLQLFSACLLVRKTEFQTPHLSRVDFYYCVCGAGPHPQGMLLSPFHLLIFYSYWGTCRALQTICSRWALQLLLRSHPTMESYSYPCFVLQAYIFSACRGVLISAQCYLFLI